MAEDEAQVLAKAKKLSWEDRIAHKNWKVRSDAYTDMAAACQAAMSPSDPVLSEFGELFGKAVGDANAPAQDKALDALLIYLEKIEDGSAGRVAHDVSKAIVKTCLKGRPGTVKKATDACLMFCELGQAANVVETLITACGDKVAKAALAALLAIHECFRTFGAKVVQPQPILKGIPPLFESKDGKMRDAVKSLTVEMTRWVGADLVRNVLMEKMREAMKKDVEDMLSSVEPGKPKPERYTRKDQKAMAAKAAAAAAAAAAAPEGGDEAGPAAVSRSQTAAAAVVDDDEGDDEMDSYEFAPEVAILPELKAAWWSRTEAAKWSERRDALVELKGLSRAPRLANGDYGDVMRLLKKLIGKDSNVAVVNEAVQCAGNLAKGLRKEFRQDARILFPVLREKTKDKNTGVLRAVDTTMGMFHKFCVTLDMIADDVLEGVQDKNPKCRAAILNFIAESVRDESTKDAAKSHALLLAPVVKAVADADPSVREGAFAALAAYAVKAGSMGGAIGKATGALDDKQTKKLMDLVQGGGPPKAAAGGVRASASRPGTAAGKRPATAPAPPLSSRDTNAATPRASVSKKPAAGKKPAAAARPAAADDDDVALNQAPSISDDDAIERMAGLAGAAAVANLRSADWKLRVEGMEAVVEAIDAGKENLDAEATVQALMALPGLTEKNVSVTAKMIGALIALSASEGFKKREAFHSIKVLEKISDSKLKEPVGNLLSACAEACGLSFVLTQVHKQAGGHRNPKVLAESVAWMGRAMGEFGLAGCKPGDIIGWMKEYLGGTNAAAKTAAVKTLGVMHSAIGPSVKNFLGDIKPALMSQIEAEFANPVEVMAPTRKARSAKPKARPAAAAASGGAGAEEGGEEEEDGGVNMDDMFPREDISGKITAKLVKDLDSANWKERQAALQEVDQILIGANNRILPPTGDLIPALKGRLKDTNKNLIAAAIKTIGALAQAMGAPFRHELSKVAADCVKNFSDSKPVVRSAVSEMLSACVAGIPLKHVLPYVSEYFPTAKASTDGKKEAMSWLAGAAGGKVQEADLPEAMRICALGLGDKDSGVRTEANRALGALAGAVGSAALVGAAGGLKSKERDVVLPAIDKAAGGAAPAPAAPMARPGTATGSRPATAPAARPESARPGTAPPRAAAAAAPKTKARDVPMSMRASMASTAGHVLDESADSPLLLPNYDKEARVPSGPLGRAKGKFEEPRPEHVEELQAAFEPFLRRDMAEALFSKDFKKHCAALDGFTQALPELGEALYGNMDLLLRWNVLRLCDTNTTALVKSLEFLTAMLAQLQAEGYAITDWEANNFAPAVVEKCGHNNDRIRSSFREILRLMCEVYSPSKVFNFVLDGTKAKNNRTRIECLEFLVELLGKYGMSVCGAPSKVLPGLAKIVAERDAKLRAAALDVLAAVYKMEGESVWKSLGTLQAAQKGLLDDKFKYVVKQMAKDGQGKPGDFRPHGAAAARGPAPSPARAAPERASAAAALAPAEAAPRAHPGPMSSSVVVGSSQAAEVRSHDFHRQTTTPSGLPRTFSQEGATPEGRGGGERLSLGGARSDEDVAEDWRKALMSVSSLSDAESVEGMKLVCHELMAAAGGQHSATSVALFASQADGLATVLARKVDTFFDDATAAGAGASTRPCKYVLNTLMQTFQLEQLSQAVSEGALRELIGLLLIRLLDERVPLLEEGPQLLKALNVLMLKILENSSRTSCFSLLLLLLRVPPPRVAQGDAGLQAKFCDLIVKCLIKLTKALSTSLPSVDVDTLLLSIHGFFMGLGVDEIRKRGAEDDKPLRMVKTVLHELTKLMGPSIRGHLSKVPRTEPPPIIHAYIDLNLQTLQTAGIIPADGPAGAGVEGGGGGGAAMPPTDLKAQLATVFKKIGDKQTTAQGLEELYHFTKAHPSIDISPHLSKTSDAFRLYIQRGLAKVEAAERASQGGAPSPGGALATPDVAGRLVSPGGSRAGATNLDELRERMRSIQATVGSSISASPAAAAAAAAAPSPAKSMAASTTSLSALQERMNRLRASTNE